MQHLKDGVEKLFRRVGNWYWAQTSDAQRLERLVLRARQRGYEAAKQEYEARQQAHDAARLAYERERTILRRQQQECQKKQLRLDEGMRWVKEERRRLEYLREEQERLEQEVAGADVAILEKEKGEELWQSQEEVGFEDDYDPDNEHDPSVDYGPGDDISEEERSRGSDY